MGQFGIGQPVPRSEDPRLLCGKGTFIDDIERPGCLAAYVLRSPFANAAVAVGDLTAAEAAPGVRLVLTGADYAASGLGAQTPLVPRERPGGEPAFSRPHPPLVEDRARYVGDAVAFDHHIAALAQMRRGAVEQGGVAEQHGGHFAASTPGQV